MNHQLPWGKTITTADARAIIRASADKALDFPRYGAKARHLLCFAAAHLGADEHFAHMPLAAGIARDFPDVPMEHALAAMFSGSKAKRLAEQVQGGSNAKASGESAVQLLNAGITILAERIGGDRMRAAQIVNERCPALMQAVRDESAPTQSHSSTPAVGTAVATWNAAIAAQRAHCTTDAQAIANVVKQNPELHAAYLREVNNH